MTRLFSAIARFSWIRAGCVMVLGLILSGCGQGPAPDNSASNLMPVLSGYSSESTLNIQDAIAKLGSAAGLVGAQPEIPVVITAVNGLLTCYEKAGAIVGQAYVNQANPINAGLV